jgi:hypothetical protein
VRIGDAARMDAAAIIARVVAHAGGAERWDALEALEVRVKVGGLAFRMFGQGEAVSDFDAVVWVHEPRVSFASRVVADWRGEFDAGTVRLHDAEGAVTAERPDAVFVRRAPWPKPRWDAIDAMAFSGHALWHYTTFPALLRRADVRVASRGERTIAGEPLHGLRLHCPPQVPAHAPDSSLWVRPDGTMRRFDYHARMIAPWAIAANRCLSDTTAFGITIPDVRRVTPLAPGLRAAPGPLLVAIELELTGVRER